MPIAEVDEHDWNAPFPIDDSLEPGFGKSDCRKRPDSAKLPQQTASRAEEQRIDDCEVPYKKLSASIRERRAAGSDMTVRRALRSANEDCPEEKESKLLTGFGAIHMPSRDTEVEDLWGMSPKLHEEPCTPKGMLTNAFGRWRNVDW
jgi:hypothetical protein